MHIASTANETLNLLWNNYSTLCVQVNPGNMSPETLEIHRNSPLRPFRIATWLARQFIIIAAWSLWEYYSRKLCEHLPIQEKKVKHESTIDWVGRSLKANSIAFSNQTWFGDAYCLRNLILHNGCRVDTTKANTLFKRACDAFPNTTILPDHYIDLTNDHVAELQFNIKNFVDETAKSSPQ